MRASFMPSDPCGMLTVACAGIGFAIACDCRRPVAIRHGGVAEWPKALVLKTSEPRGSVGSNPTPTAILQIRVLVSIPVARRARVPRVALLPRGSYSASTLVRDGLGEVAGHDWQPAEFHWFHARRPYRKTVESDRFNPSGLVLPSHGQNHRAVVIMQQ